MSRVGVAPVHSWLRSTKAGTSSPKKPQVNGVPTAPAVGSLATVRSQVTPVHLAVMVSVASLSPPVSTTSVITGRASRPAGSPRAVPSTAAMFQSREGFMVGSELEGSHS